MPTRRLFVPNQPQTRHILQCFYIMQSKPKQCVFNADWAHHLYVEKKVFMSSCWAADDSAQIAVCVKSSSGRRLSIKGVCQCPEYYLVVEQQPTKHTTLCVSSSRTFYKSKFNYCCKYNCLSSQDMSQRSCYIISK